MGIFQFFSTCFSRCRQREPIELERADESLLFTQEEKKSNHEIIVNIQNKQSSFQEAKLELTTCISFLEAHKRSLKVKGYIPAGLMAIIIGSITLKIISNYSTHHRHELELATFESRYDTTWTNFSYIYAPFGQAITSSTPQPWPRAYGNTTCKYATYPFNYTFDDPFVHWIYQSEPMKNIYCDFLSDLDFRSTTGLLVCVPIIYDVCDAFVRLRLDGGVELYLIAGVCVLLMLFCCYCPLPPSCVPCGKIDSTNSDILYDVAKKHFIFLDSQQNFDDSLKLQPYNMLCVFQRALQELEEKHYKYLSRLAIVDGFLRKPTNTSSLTVLRDDPCFEKKLLKNIFELADIDNGQRVARRALLDATQEKNRLRPKASNLHRFFHRLNEKDEDDVNKYDKKKIVVDNIFKFAGV